MMEKNLLKVVVILKEVVANTTADIGVLNALNGANFTVQINQRTVVAVKIWAWLWVQARWASALGTQFGFLTT